MSSTCHSPRRRWLGVGLTLLTSLVATLTLLPGAPAVAAPNRVDLVVTATATDGDVVDVGGGAAVMVGVRNAGTAAAQDVTVTYALPPDADFTDGNEPPAGWMCDFGARTCTYGALAAGASAPSLKFYFYFPPAPVGTTTAVTATATTSSVERRTANNVDDAPITYVRGVTDIEVVNVSATPSAAIVGDTVSISIQVRNTGNMTAEQVHVTVPVPAGLTRLSEESGLGWYCSFGTDPVTGQPAWRCTRYQLVVEPATVRGTVWHDADRDSVRDAEETGVTGADLTVWVSPDLGGLPAAVAADGTYSAQFRPGGVAVQFLIAKPYCFIDSADGDLAGYDNSSPDSSRAWSNPASVSPGGEVVIDAAVVTC